MDIKGHICLPGKQPGRPDEGVEFLKDRIKLCGNGVEVELAEVPTQSPAERTASVTPSDGPIESLSAGFGSTIGELVSDFTASEKIKQLGMVVLSVVVERQIDMFVDCLLGGRKESD